MVALKNYLYIFVVLRWFILTLVALKEIFWNENSNEYCSSKEIKSVDGFFVKAV